MDMNVKISLCMIVKNEEDVIARCLDSVSRCVDEIIIADTGSSDRTKEICRDFTDKIFDFEWTDDFSAARNFSFSKATGDYLMWLDADDVVSSENIGLLKELKKTLAQKNPDVVMCRYVTSFDENGPPLFSFFRERLLKRTANFKWEGFIHECISPRGNIIYSDFTVHHNAAADAGAQGDQNHAAIAPATEISESFRKKFRRALSLTRATPFITAGSCVTTKCTRRERRCWKERWIWI